MKEIMNASFVKEGRYVNPLTFKKGLIVSRAFSPRGYINKEGEDESAWLPELIICEASEDAPIRVIGRGIIAKGPAIFYALQFNPIWNGNDGKNKNIIHRFEKAFVPEEDKIGDIAVNKYKLSEIYDKNTIPGEISYSGIDNRDITLHGKKDELANMVLITSRRGFPSKSYALDYGEHSAHSKKIYTIKISEEEMQKFVKDIASKIF